MNIPILADTTHSISIDYGCYKADEGIAYRGLYIIDTKGQQSVINGLVDDNTEQQTTVLCYTHYLGILRQITINDLPVGRSVEEVLRLVQASFFRQYHVCSAWLQCTGHYANIGFML